MRLRNKDAGTGKVLAVKSVSGTDGVSKRLKCYFCGFVTEKGVKWALWTPTGWSLSSMVRKEAPGKRTRFVYDAGHGLRRSVQNSGGHLVR